MTSCLVPVNLAAESSRPEQARKHCIELLTDLCSLIQQSPEHLPAGTLRHKGTWF